MDEIKTYNAYEDDLLEALSLLKEAKKTGKHITINLTYGTTVKTVNSADKESTWYSKFYGSRSEEEVIMKCSEGINDRFPFVLSRAQMLENHLKRCKYYIYPQRAQQLLEEIESMPEFEHIYQHYCVNQIESSREPYTTFCVKIVDLFDKVFHNNVEFNDSKEAFEEIMYNIKQHEQFVKNNPTKGRDRYSEFDRYKIFSAFIKYYPGGVELVEKYDPAFLEEHKEEFKDIIAENEKFKQELLDRSIDPVVSESPIEKANQYIKTTILEMIEHIKQYGLRPCLSIYYSYFSRDDVLELLKHAKENGEPLTINRASSENTEESWYRKITEQSQKRYLAEKESENARAKVQEQMLAEIKEQYIDQMREHIYPQRFQYWKYFVDLYVKVHSWGEPPVSLDYLIKILADYIPKINSGSEDVYKEVAREINGTDGPYHIASIVNIMLFAKNGPDFVKTKFPSVCRSHKRNFNCIVAENAIFEEELKKHQQSFE